MTYQVKNKSAKQIGAFFAKHIGAENVEVFLGGREYASTVDLSYNEESTEIKVTSYDLSYPVKTCSEILKELTK